MIQFGSLRCRFRQLEELHLTGRGVTIGGLCALVQLPQLCRLFLDFTCTLAKESEAAPLLELFQGRQEPLQLHLFNEVWA